MCLKKEGVLSLSQSEIDEKGIYEEITKEIKKLRNYYYYDKEIISEDSKCYDSVEEIKNNLELGNFHIAINSVRFDCFVQSKENIRPKKLYVIYAGGRPESAPFPYFVRWSYYPLIESLDSMILCISDPMFQRYEKLFLGWYYGTKEECYITLSLEVVKSVCDNANIRYEDVIFLGSSGGGYASIYASALLKGSSSVSINPQIYIRRYSYCQKFEMITGLDLKAPDKFLRNDLVNIKKNSNSKHCVMVNVQSTDDMEKQIIPMAKELGIPIKYGLSSKDNVLVWLYDCAGLPEAHTSQETRSVFYAIDYIVNAFHSGANTTNMQDFILFVNECWHDVFEHKVIIERLKQEFIWLGGNNLLQEVDYEKCIENHHIKETSSQYNFWKCDICDNNAYYYVTILGVEADFPEYTVGVYDFKNSRKLHFESYKTQEEVNISFVVGKVENIALCIYAGIHGQTKGKSLKIGELSIKRKKIGL